MSGPVTIDGQLDEDAWKGLLQETNFKILSQMKVTDKLALERTGR